MAPSGSSPAAQLNSRNRNIRSSASSSGASAKALSGRTTRNLELASLLMTNAYRATAGITSPLVLAFGLPPAAPRRD